MKRISLVVMAAVTIAACGGPSDLEAVKSGTMTGYETTTVGQAFEASFDEPQWKAFETEKGQRTVEFNGKVSQKLHAAFVAFMRTNYSAEGIFNAASLSDYPAPADDMPESQYPEWEAAFLHTLWPPGADFKAQWTILADGPGSMQITHMSIAGNQIDEYGTVLALVLQ